MGAETDLLPPPVPEPDDVRGHGDQSWKADMMSALGESVSFGRFLAEPLDWGKWSSFAHNRYLEEAARQARPGSVAQKKALFEAHYARKRRTEADADVDADAGSEEGGYEEDIQAEDAGGAAASVSSSSAAGSSCMTDDAAPPGQEVCGGGGDLDDAVECGTAAGGGPAGDAGDEEVEAISNGVRSACKKDEEAADEVGNRVSDGVGSACKMDEEAADVSRSRDSDVAQSKEKQDSCNGHFVPVDAVERQPLKESSVANQDGTDSTRKRRLQMPSLLQKPGKLSSPSSGKKGQSSSAKRRSVLHSSKENASHPSTDSSKRSASSGLKNRSTLSELHMSMSSFSRFETGTAASSSRNLGTTIADRISQLQSASRPVENSQPKEFRPQRKVSCRASLEIAPKTSQVDEQRLSHVMRVKQKLFGSTSPSVTQNPGSTRKKQKKPDNEPEFKEPQQSFCFKTRSLANFCWKNKQAKDSYQQNAQEIQHLPNSSQLSGVNGTHQMGEVVFKEKQICCFPIKKLY